LLVLVFKCKLKLCPIMLSLNPYIIPLQIQSLMTRFNLLNKELIEKETILLSKSKYKTVCLLELKFINLTMIKEKLENSFRVD